MAGQVLSFWDDLLRLADYEVVHFREESDLGLYCFTVTPRHRVGVCPHCKGLCEKVHQARTREGIRDLPISRYGVELKVRVLQFDCEHCGKAFTPPVPFLAEGSHATERFLQRAAELIRTSDVANTAAFFGVPERTLAGWYYDHLRRQQQQQQQQQQQGSESLKPIKRIGIDELSLKKNIVSSSR